MPETDADLDLELGLEPELQGKADKPSRPSMVRTLLVITITLAVVVAGLWIVDLVRGGDTAANANPSESAGAVSSIDVKGKGPAPKVGNAAPSFTTFSTTGEAVSLEELKGKPVWLVFGATWCANCRTETPDVEAIKEKYGDDVEIVAVYIGESLTTVTDYSDRLKLSYTQVADESEDIGGQYRVMGLPTHYFVDADGKVQSIEVGTLSQAAASKKIDELAGAGAK